MRIKIDMDIPRWASRLILIGLPVAIVAIAAWAYADVKTFTAGDKLTAKDLNDSFTALQTAINQATPPGSIAAFAGPVVPAGWLLCDGTAVKRSDYSSLFAAIGTVHGSGDGASTFNLPDYRGMFLRGVDGTAGNDPDSATRAAAKTGGNAGNRVGSFQGDTMQGHIHGHKTVSSTTAYSDLVGTYMQARDIPSALTTYVDNMITSPANDGTNGAPRTSRETRPMNAYVNFIIKT
jgi:microcystin-dependent protein